MSLWLLILLWGEPLCVLLCILWWGLACRELLCGMWWGLWCCCDLEGGIALEWRGDSGCGTRGGDITLLSRLWFGFLGRKGVLPWALSLRSPGSLSNLYILKLPSTCCCPKIKIANYLNYKSQVYVYKGTCSHDPGLALLGLSAPNSWAGNCSSAHYCLRSNVWSYIQQCCGAGWGKNEYLIRLKLTRTQWNTLGIHILFYMHVYIWNVWLHVWVGSKLTWEVNSCSSDEHVLFWLEIIPSCHFYFVKVKFILLYAEGKCLFPLRIRCAFYVPGTSLLCYSTVKHCATL